MHNEISQMSITVILTAVVRFWLNVYSSVTCTPQWRVLLSDVYFSVTWAPEQVLFSWKDSSQTVNQFLPIWKGGGGPPWSKPEWGCIRTGAVRCLIFSSLPPLIVQRDDNFPLQLVFQRDSLVEDCLIRKGRAFEPRSFTLIPIERFPVIEIS